MTMTLVEDPIDLADGVYEGTAPVLELVDYPSSLVASAIPLKPPRDWFDDPKLDGITPLVIESSGRVYGHLAGWRQDHIGMNGRIRAPKSQSGYAFFATGALECDTGEQVHVGQISLVGGHASLEASVAEAVAHYDDTDSAMMDVAVGEDRHGIWVAGALRPDVDELKLRKLRASGVSGDWRPINGHLELVAACSVNVPGFPIPRARVAAGQPVALIAAGATEVAEAAIALYARGEDSDRVDAICASLDERLRLVEDALLGRVLERRESLVAAVEASYDFGDVPDAEVIEDVAEDTPIDPTEPVEPIPVDPGPVPDPQPIEVPPPDGVVDLDALRSRVRPVETWLTDGMPIDMSMGECLQASLRARAHGPLVARATSHWDKKHRDTASKRGVAMPDGSYPISDRDDLRKAVQSLGRAKDRAKTVRHIKKRAKALGAEKSVENLKA